MVWKIYRSTFQQTEDISIVFLWRIWCQSVRKKFLVEARLIYAKEVSIKFHYLMKKKKTQLKTKQLKQNIFKSMEGMGFRKPNNIIQKH